MSIEQQSDTYWGWKEDKITKSAPSRAPIVNRKKDYDIHQFKWSTKESAVNVKELLN